MPRIAIDGRKIHDFGIGTYIQELVHGLLDLPGSEHYVLLLPAEGPGLETSERLQIIRCKSRGYSLGEHFELPRRLYRTSADLVHIPHYVRPWQLRIPSVVTIHDLIHLTSRHYRWRPHYLYARLLLGRAYRQADRILTVSEASKLELLGFFGGDPERIAVTPNTVSQEFFQPVSAEERSATSRRLALPPRFLLHVGNLLPHKNIERLLEAHAGLPESGRLPLVLAGGSRSQFEPLRHTARRLQVESEVHHLGSVKTSTLRALYHLATALLFPTLQEGFGLPPVEAMACGLPVAASRIPAVEEVCRGAALLFDPRDIKAIREAMRDVQDASTATRLQAAGRRTAAGHRDTCPARLTLEVYRQVLRRAPCQA